jgi:hypothetical protein
METKLQRRNEISLRSAKHSQVFSVLCDSVFGFPVEGRFSGFQFRREIWNGAGHARVAGEYYSTDDVHAILPFLAAPCGGQAGLFFVCNVWEASVQGLEVADDFE